MEILRTLSFHLIFFVIICSFITLASFIFSTSSTNQKETISFEEPEISLILENETKLTEKSFLEEKKIKEQNFTKNLRIFNGNIPIEEFGNATVVISGVVFEGNISEDTPYNIFTIQNLRSNQIVYFNLKDLNDNVSVVSNGFVEIYDETFEQMQMELITLEKDLKGLFGSFEVYSKGDWYFVFNSSSQGKYELLIQIPEDGYNLETAVPLVANTLQISDFRCRQEKQYWRIDLYPNQRAWINAKEEYNNVLERAYVKILVTDDPNPPNSIETFTELEGKLDGNITGTWKATKDSVFFAEISHSKDFPLGNYSLELLVQNAGYNFTTAINIYPNATYGNDPDEQFSNITITDSYREITYFKFQVVYEGVDVRFSVNETSPEVLEEAYLEFYDQGRNHPLFIQLEQNSYIDGSIYGTFYVSSSGWYYVVVNIPRGGYKGVYTVRIEYNKPKYFVWSWEAMVITSIFLGIVPVGLYIFEQQKGSETTEHNLTVPLEHKRVFDIFSRNPRLEPKTIVPNDRIMISGSLTSLSGDVLFKFVEISEMETSILIEREKKVWEVFQYFFLATILYYIINYLYFLQYHQTFLPIPIATEYNIHFMFMSICFLLFLAWCITSGVRDFALNQLIKEANFTILRIASDDDSIPLMNKKISLEMVNKNISYIRVLWNRAKRSFKDQNYGMFIIKADSAIKKLLETRYIQLFPDSNERMSFQDIIDAIRIQGFDIPSAKKIEYFRKLRNRVVHSSLTLDEKTAIETYGYYSKFLARLGLRE